MFGTAAAIFSVLLVVTGIAKLRRPSETSKSMAALGLPSHVAFAWLLGLAEVLVGLAVLATGSAVSYLAQGILYLGFTAWVIAAIRTDVPLASCGCLGRDDTPPYWGHVVLDSLGVVVSLAAALSPRAVPVEPTLESGAALLLVGVGAFLSWLIIDHAARLSGVIRG